MRQDLVQMSNVRHCIQSPALLLLRCIPDFQKSVSAALHEPAYRPDTLVRHKQALHLLARTRHLADTGLACPGDE